MAELDYVYWYLYISGEECKDAWDVYEAMVSIRGMGRMQYIGGGEITYLTCN